MVAILLYGVVTIAVTVLVFWLFKPVFNSMQDMPAVDYEHELVDPTQPTGPEKKFAFPSVFEKPTVNLSLIVPAYNEENRLPSMMNETLNYLEERKARDPYFTWEIIIVDDGSKDNTANVALSYANDSGVERVRLLKLKRNQGKGGAVQQGMLHARGEYLLFLDADGATNIKDLDRVELQLKAIEQQGLGVSIGSRAHLEGDAVATRTFLRNILMWGFHLLVAVTCVRGIRDTQCGFKLFSRRAAQHIFLNQHLRRWSFDVELLFLARALRIPIVEVPVNWTEVPGSKLDLLESSITMARDLVIIRLAHMLGIWKINTPQPFLHKYQHQF